MFYLLHSSQASWQFGGHKKNEEKDVFFLCKLCVQPPSQTTGSHKTEFVFDVRQFGVLQRAPVTLLYPRPFIHRAAKNHKQKKSHKERKKKKKEI